MSCTQNFSTLPDSHSPWELEGSPGHLRQGAPASRSGVQIPQTKSQSCHITATLGKSVGFFQVEFLPCSISRCNFQLYPRKTHRMSVSFSPTKQLRDSQKSTSSPQHSRISAEKHQAEQGRPEAAAPRRKCPHMAFSATWPASFQGCISAQSVTFQDGHLSQGQPSVCSPCVSNLTHSPRPSPSSSCSFSSDERLVAA